MNILKICFCALMVLSVSSVVSANSETVQEAFRKAIDNKNLSHLRILRWDMIEKEWDSKTDYTEIVDRFADDLNYDHSTLCNVFAQREHSNILKNYERTKRVLPLFDAFENSWFKNLKEIRATFPNEKYRLNFLNSFQTIRKLFLNSEKKIKCSMFKVLSENTIPKDSALNYFDFVKDFQIPDAARNDLSFEFFIEVFSSAKAQEIKEKACEPLLESESSGACALPLGSNAKKDSWTEGDLVAVAKLLVDLDLLTAEERHIIVNHTEIVTGELDEGNLSPVLDKICTLLENKKLKKEIVWRIIREGIYLFDPLPLAADPCSKQKVTDPDADEEYARLLQEKEDYLYALSLANQR